MFIIIFIILQISSGIFIPCNGFVILTLMSSFRTLQKNKKNFCFATSPYLLVLSLPSTSVLRIADPLPIKGGVHAGRAVPGSRHSRSRTIAPAGPIQFGARHRRAIDGDGGVRHRRLAAPLINKGQSGDRPVAGALEILRFPVSSWPSK